METITEYKSAYADGYVMALNFADLNLMSLRVMVESGCWDKDELLGQIDRMAQDIKELQTQKEN
jgi:hypothetical protein